MSYVSLKISVTLEAIASLRGDVAAMAGGAELVSEGRHTLLGCEKIQMALLGDPLVTESAAYAQRDMLLMGELDERGAHRDLR